MITLRKASDRGHANHGWLDSHHTFAFADYYDPAHMGFGALRVINDDRVSPGHGFPTHGHKDMEIISYVLDGGLEHKDSIGTGSVIRPGDVQRMSAGTGVRHSEYNASKEKPVHFLQIWIVPEKQSIAPGYEQKTFGDERHGKLRLVASRDGREGSVTIHQDASLYAAMLAEGESVVHAPARARRLWVHVAEGSARVNGTPMGEGDGAAITGETEVRIEGAGAGRANVLLFDLGL